MKYFTLRSSPPKNFLTNGNDRNGTSHPGINGELHSSAHNLSNGNTQEPAPQKSGHYFYAQPRQKQRPQLAQHFNIKACNPQSRRSVVGNSNGIIGGSEYDNQENTFVAPKSAPLPRKSYNGQRVTLLNHNHDYNEKKQNGFYEQNDFDYEGFAIAHKNGTLPSKVRRREFSNGIIESNENNSKLLAPFQKLLYRQKVRGVPFSSSKENLSSPEETENNANHKLFYNHHQHHNHQENNNDIRNNINNPEYGELREIVRRIEQQQEQQYSNNNDAQYLNKQVKHHPVLLVQQRLHHATLSPNMQNEFGSDFKYAGNGVVTNGKVGGKLLSTTSNKKKNSAFNYLSDSVTQR